jgi:transcriptional regulator with XRE-family HTH domain
MPKKSKRNVRASGEVDGYVGQRVRQLRMQIGLSQQQIGEALGISFQQIQKYEKGTNRLSAGRLIELAVALNTTPHDLLGYDDDAPKKGLNAFNTEIYKLAQEFADLPEALITPIRQMITALIETYHGGRKKTG